MPHSQSLISIIIPAYNAETYIKKALDSVLTQSYRHFEVLVINDGSTDNTETIARSYDDTRIRLISQPNGGLSNARNTGIRSAKGDYLAFLDADDYWMPEKLALQLELLNHHPEIGFCSTRTRVETPTGEFINDWPCPNINTSTLHTIFAQNAAIAGSGSSVMARKNYNSRPDFLTNR
nr:glycosyltransferase family A protein [Methylomarinum sp. Ch1-1]MDP4521204.1 glycosyltransferase family A protein [Methylomarinum sp. Ch1-1]